MKRNELNFDNLLNKTLNLWPREIIFGDLSFNSNRPDLYTVSGLYEINESIDIKSLASSRKILWLNLNWSIYTVIHKIALYSKKFHTDDLRPGPVRLRFEDILEKIRQSNEQEWDGAQMQVLENYFKVNQKQR